MLCSWVFIGVLAFDYQVGRHSMQISDSVGLPSLPLQLKALLLVSTVLKDSIRPGVGKLVVELRPGLLALL